MASSILLIFSPFLTWITIVSVVLYRNVIVFGAAAQSNLLMVSSNQLGTGISSTASVGATASVILLIAGGLVMMKSAKVGVPIATAGLLTYIIPLLNVFGPSASGLEQTFISPGIGLFVAGTGVALGSLSPIAKSETYSSLLASVRKGRGLSVIGVSFSVIGLGIDFLDHTVLGQLPNFVGLTPIQQTLHVGLVLGIASLTIAVAMGSRLENKYLLYLSVATLLLLAADATYSISTGNLNSFLGHNLTETVLHLSVYYGVTMTLISTFLRSD